MSERRPVATSAPARWDRVATAAVALIPVAVALPYLVAGPGFLADDWVWLRNASFHGWLHASGSRFDGRPGGALLTALVFGVIGNHPLPVALVLTGLRVVAALLVLRAARELLDGRLAVVLVVVWLVMPGHAALEMWASMTFAAVAVGLLAAGVTELSRAHRRPVPSGRHLAVAYLLLLAAGSFYELTSVAAGLAVLAVPLLRGHALRDRWRSIAVGGALVGLPLLWASLRASVYDTTTTGWLDPSLVLLGNLSLGLAPFGPQGRLVAGLGLALVLYSLATVVRPALGRRAGRAEHLVVAGAAVLVAGVVPLVHLANNFYGMHDRLTAVSGMGAAMVWTGGGLLLLRVAGRRAVVAAVVAVVAALVVPIRVLRVQEFVDAGQQARDTVRDVAPRAAAARYLELEEPVAVVNRIWGLNDGVNTTAAVQLYLHDPTVLVQVVPPRP